MLFSFGEPSWAVVGDTYVLGCKFPKNIVFNEALTNSPEYGKYDELGIYQVKCGIENLTLSYGHDEYLYTVLKNNKNHKISDKYLKIIRYHSFYPWHTYNEYKQFMVDSDYNILKNVKEFNQFDLYSKEDNTNISNDIKEYYDNLKIQLDDYITYETKVSEYNTIITELQERKNEINNTLSDSISKLLTVARENKKKMEMNLKEVIHRKRLKLTLPSLPK